MTPMATRRSEAGHISCPAMFASRRWRVQPCIERESRLKLHGIGVRGSPRHEDEVPATRRHRTWDRDEAMLSNQSSPNDCWPALGIPGRYPIWIGYAGGIDGMHHGNVNDDRGQDVGNRVQRAKNCCEPRPRGSRSTCRSNIDRPGALAVSATAHAIAAFTAIAGRGIGGLVEATGDKLAATKHNSAEVSCIDAEFEP